MAFTFRAETLKLNLDSFKRDLFIKIEILMKQAGKEFVRAAAPRIPVQTGFAKGSLIPLADITGAELLFTILNVMNLRYKGILKSPITGSLFSTPGVEIFTKEGSIFYFNYESNIIYYFLEDRFAGVSPTSPWGSFEAGTEAFIAHVKAFIAQNIPLLTKHLIKATVEVK